MFLIRLDDACEYMDVYKWKKIEDILDKYKVKPLVGIIPLCEDPKIKGVFPKDAGFWDKEKSWERKGWTIALHGYQHLYISKQGGVNPLHKRSEFAGISLEEQREKIRNGLLILHEHNIVPTVFFAPGHTFDKNTLLALEKESDIRVISDTIASQVYFQDNFWFVPQQSGACRKLPVKIATYCFHPNTMNEKDFMALEDFLKNNKKNSIDFSQLDLTTKRKMSLYDISLKNIYYALRKIRGLE